MALNKEVGKDETGLFQSLFLSNLFLLRANYPFVKNICKFGFSNINKELI